MHQHKYRLIIPFLAPAILIYALFVLWPYSQSFYVALTGWKGVSANKPFVGFDNFVRLVHDPYFWNALKHNGIMLVVFPAITLVIALFFATLFTQGGHGIRGSGVYRVIFFFPQVMSVVILGVLWSFVYHPGFGVVNSFLGGIGLEGWQRPWLGDEGTALWALLAVLVWQSVGFYMVLFIAGMQAIPVTFYEAATIDGAGRWTSFRHVTLPLLWDNVQVALVYIGIIALDLFTIVQVMTEGGPNRATDVVALYMYDTAFQYSEFGYATAIGVSLLLLTMTFSLLTMRMTRRETYEY